VGWVVCCQHANNAEPATLSGADPSEDPSFPTPGCKPIPLSRHVRPLGRTADRCKHALSGEAVAGSVPAMPMRHRHQAPAVPGCDIAAPCMSVTHTHRRCCISSCFMFYPSPTWKHTHVHGVHDASSAHKAAWLAQPRLMFQLL